MLDPFYAENRPDPLAIVTGDWHLKPGDRIWKYRKNPSGDSWFSMKQIASAINKLNPRYLFLLGDIFHAPVNPSDVLSRFREFLKLLQVPVRVFYLQGQHDMADPPWLSLVEGNPGHPVPSRISGLLRDEPTGVVFWGLDYTPSAQEAFNAILEGSKNGGIDVLLTHQAWTEAIGFGGGNASFEFLRDFSGVKKIISGDLHKSTHFNIPLHDPLSFFVSKKPNDYEVGKLLELVFPGPICITDLNSHPPFSCLVLYEDLSYARYSLRGRVYVSGQVNTDEQFDAFIEKNPPSGLIDPTLPEEIQKPIVYLKGDPKLLLRGRDVYGKDTYYIMSCVKENKDTKAIPRVEGSDIRTQILNYLKQKYPTYAASFSHLLTSVTDGYDTKAAISRAISSITGDDSGDAIW